MASRLFGLVLPEFKDNHCVLLAGSAIFAALGLDARSILGDDAIQWPEAGSQYAVDIAENPEDLEQEASAVKKKNFSYEFFH